MKPQALAAYLMLFALAFAVKFDSEYTRQIFDKLADDKRHRTPNSKALSLSLQNSSQSDSLEEMVPKHIGAPNSFNRRRQQEPKRRSESHDPHSGFPHYQDTLNPKEKTSDQQKLVMEKLRKLHRSEHSSSLKRHFKKQKRLNMSHSEDSRSSQKGHSLTKGKGIKMMPGAKNYSKSQKRKHLSRSNQVKNHSKYRLHKKNKNVKRKTHSRKRKNNRSVCCSRSRHNRRHKKRTISRKYGKRAKKHLSSKQSSHYKNQNEWIGSPIEPGRRLLHSKKKQDKKYLDKSYEVKVYSEPLYTPKTFLATMNESLLKDKTTKAENLKKYPKNVIIVDLNEKKAEPVTVKKAEPNNNKKPHHKESPKTNNQKVNSSKPDINHIRGPKHASSYQRHLTHPPLKPKLVKHPPKDNHKPPKQKENKQRTEKARRKR
jgi:hypothetical protein